MILRWTAAGVLEAERHFRKVAGYRALPKLVAALREAENNFRRLQGAKGGMPILLNALQKNDERFDERLDEAKEAR